MQRIRSQIASEIRKGTVQRVELPTRRVATSHKVEDVPNKSQSNGKNMSKPKGISPCTESDTASLEDFDLGKQKLDSTLIHEESLPTVNENDSPLSPPSNPVSSYALTWDELNSDLQLALPPDEKYTYVVEAYHQNKKLEFQGAPALAFEAQVRINVKNESEAGEWLDKMQKHSQVTYRVTRTYKPGLKRVLCKLERHCQHFRKPLTRKQIAKGAVAKAKKARTPLTGMLRNKKTECSSHLTLTVQIPTKKQTRAAEVKPYLLTHTGLLNLDFTHNHPISSAHALSFRDVLEETKQAFYSYFEMGHSASSARHAHEHALYMEANSEADSQTRMADRAQNPLLQDICRLFRHWRENVYGADDGKNVFDKLQEKVDQYNAENEACGGKAFLQWYEAPVSDTADELEGKAPPAKRKKRELTEKPLVLAICTPLMARAHRNVMQAGEIVFCDSSSSMDRFNTSVFILSTTTACSGIPLAVVMTSDETEETITWAMEKVKEVIPSDAFHGNGPGLGPAVFMIDDSVVEQAALSKCWPMAKILLCTFHFLQRRWTWLYDGKKQNPEGGQSCTHTAH